MSKGTGIKGVTVPKLSRKNRADGRKALYDDRTPEKQIAELDYRGARAVRERKRLAAALRGSQGAKP